MNENQSTTLFPIPHQPPPLSHFFFFRQVKFLGKDGFPIDLIYIPVDSFIINSDFKTGLILMGG